MRHVLPLALLLAAAAPAEASAQARPDFSGTWSLPPDAPMAPNGKPAPAPGFGPTINIVHQGNDLTISRVLGGGTVHVVHTLDGSETRSRTPGRLCQGETQSVWRATWQGEAILTTLVATSPAGAPPTTKMDVKTTFTLQPTNRLLVEMTFRNPGMAEPRTIATTYQKSGPPAPAPVSVPPLQATVAQAEWLSGTWVGTNAANTAEERWTPPSGGSMLAVSRTIRNGHMSAFEFLCIVERHGGLIYQAMPNGRQPATDFTLTKVETNSLTFENPAHDFPKMIRYSLVGDGTLEAVVSGADTQKPLVFRFRKQ